MWMEFVVPLHYEWALQDCSSSADSVTYVGAVLSALFPFAVVVYVLGLREAGQTEPRLRKPLATGAH